MGRTLSTSSVTMEAARTARAGSLVKGPGGGGDRVQGGGDVVDAEKRGLDERIAPFFFHRPRQIRHGARALHIDVERGPMRAAYFVDAAVAGHDRLDTDAHPLVVAPDDAGFSGQIEFAEDIDGERTVRYRGVPAIDRGARLRSPDKRSEGVAGRAIAVLFRASEAFRVHRDHGYAALLGYSTTDRRHIVADQADDARRVYEGRLWRVFVDQGRGPHRAASRRRRSRPSREGRL